MRRQPGHSGFTLLEMLMVIVIIMVVVALALPNFAAMMKDRAWTEALGNVQGMVMRARALATNNRCDMSVEFDYWKGGNAALDNGTHMWLESESGIVETLDDLNALALKFGLGAAPSPGSPADMAMSYLTDSGSGPWYAAGGRGCLSGYPWYKYDPKANPPDASKFADNARQCDCVVLSGRITIDPDVTWSPNFINWDAYPSGVAQSSDGWPYGRDNTNDIRIGTNGALVQPMEPTICLKRKNESERMQLTVVRCTGRVIRSR